MYFLDIRYANIATYNWTDNSSRQTKRESIEVTEKNSFVHARAAPAVEVADVVQQQERKEKNALWMKMTIDFKLVHEEMRKWAEWKLIIEARNIINRSDSVLYVFYGKLISLKEEEEEVSFCVCRAIHCNLKEKYIFVKKEKLIRSSIKKK